MLDESKFKCARIAVSKAITTTVKPYNMQPEVDIHFNPSPDAVRTILDHFPAIRMKNRLCTDIVLTTGGGYDIFAMHVYEAGRMRYIRKSKDPDTGSFVSSPKTMFFELCLDRGSKGMLLEKAEKYAEEHFKKDLASVTGYLYDKYCAAFAAKRIASEGIKIQGNIGKSPETT